MKPFRWSFCLSIPLIVAAASTAFLLLAHVERRQLVAELSACAAHASADEAALAVRRLATMPRPPIEPLVDAAAAPSRSISREGRLAIHELLRKWHRQLDSGTRVKRVHQQLEELAAALDHRASQFSPRDYAWLGKMAEKILLLANRRSDGADARVAMHCESLLTITSRMRTAAAAKPNETAVQSESRQVAPIESATRRRGEESVFDAPSESTIEALLPESTAHARPANASATSSR